MTPGTSCSRCGDARNLHLVTIPYEGRSGPGRILVYCASCRTSLANGLGVSIPLEEVTADVFLDLYSANKTASDPLTAAEIVFGVADPELVRAAQVLLEDQ